MTKLSRCTNVLLIIDDEEAMQDIFEIASSNDLSVYMADDPETVEVSLYPNILASPSMLKLVKGLRERVVVVRPPKSSIGRLVEAGYTRFLFDTTNQAEVYVSLLADGSELRSAPATKIGKILADFQRKKFTISGKEIYLSKGEQKYLLDKFILAKEEPSGASWRIHKCRIRKRFGKDVFDKESA